MDTVKFVIEDYIEPEFGIHVPTINIYINRHNLISLVQDIECKQMDFTHLQDPAWQSYIGLHPEWFCARDEFLGNTGRPFSVLLTCTCHIDLCNSVIARVQLTPHSVRWSDFSTRLYGEESRTWGCVPIDYSSLGPFMFDREQYMRALNVLDTLI